jgi:hypothetical protein
VSCDAIGISASAGENSLFICSTSLLQVLESLRKETPDAKKLTKEELISKMNEQFGSKIDNDTTD